MEEGLVESGEFVDWLAGIGRLTPVQRGQAAKALGKASRLLKKSVGRALEFLLGS